MSLCSKCNDLIQSAANRSIMRKTEELKKSGLDESSMGKVLTDPFVIMWVPENQQTVQPPKYFDPDPCCLEYDVTIDLSTCKQEWSKRRYPINPRKPKPWEIAQPQKDPTDGAGAEPLPPLTLAKTRRNNPCGKPAEEEQKEEGEGGK